MQRLLLIPTTHVVSTPHLKEHSSETQHNTGHIERTGCCPAVVAHMLLQEQLLLQAQHSSVHVLLCLVQVLQGP
jgi:hypothetical protein